MASSDLTIVNGPPQTGNVARTPAPANTSGRQDLSESGKVSPQPVEPEVTRDDIVEAVSDISDFVQTISRELQFQVDDDIGSTIITVRDRDTGDIIRQIPSEEAVQLARYIAENGPDPALGLLINSKGLK